MCFHFQRLLEIVMRKTKNKTGRRASLDERQLAQEWVDIYREAQSQPDQRICLNPGEDKKHHEFLSFTDPTPLILALEGFARHGTFEFVDEIGIAQLLVINEYKSLIARGKKPKDAVEELVDRHSKDTRTIQRWIQKYTSKVKE